MPDTPGGPETPGPPGVTPSDDLPPSEGPPPGGLPPTGDPLLDDPLYHEPPPGDPPWGGGPPPPREPQRRLSRRTDDRVLCGVASGLGDYFNVDPAIFRLAFVALTFFGGSGVVLYGLGWIFLPERTSGRSLGEDAVERVGGGRSVVTWVIIGVIAMSVLGAADIFDGGFIWAALLIGAGLLYFRRDEAGDGPRDDDRPVAATPPTTSPHPRPAAAGTTTTSQWEPRRTTTDGWRPTPIVPPPKPPPPPSVLGRITVAAALILGGMVALAHNVFSLDISIDQYAALGVAVVGAGLVFGARVGRARGLIALGVALVLTMATFANLPDLRLLDGIGQQSFRPTTAADLDEPFTLGMGQLTIDLTDLELEPGDEVTVEGALGMGEMVVDVPGGTGIELAATSSLGSVSGLGRRSDGTQARITESRAGPEGSPTIVLDLTTGMGEIEVNERSATPPSEPAPTRNGVN